MVSNRYEYETSPRKLDPNVQRKKTASKPKQNKKKKIRVVEDLPKGFIFSRERK